MKRIKHFVKEKKPNWLTRKSVLITFGALGLIGALLHLGYAVEWTGLKQDSSVTKIDRKTKEGKEVEVVTTTTNQDQKKLWDWLSLLGFPFALAVFGAYLNYLQQESERKREEQDKTNADRQEDLEKKIAEARLQEEAFQNYIDRMSDLVVDKNLVTVAGKPDKTAQDQELVEAAKTIIRARTLSILRQLNGNGRIKADVIRFLIDAEVLTKLKLDLSDADLSGADFRNSIFSGADLSSIKLNLRGSDFSYSDFTRVDLSDSVLSVNTGNLLGPNFSGASFNGALLENTQLFGANLSNAQIVDADLTHSNLMDADLSQANLMGTTLVLSDLNNANLSDAILFKASLLLASIDGAIFDNTDLEETDLRVDSGFNDSQMKTARLDKTKLWPESNLDPNRDQSKGIKFRLYIETSRRRKPTDRSIPIQIPDAQNPSSRS